MYFLYLPLYLYILAWVRGLGILSDRLTRWAAVYLSHYPPLCLSLGCSCGVPLGLLGFGVVVPPLSSFISLYTFAWVRGLGLWFNFCAYS